jgi:hypothetical protein
MSFMRKKSSLTLTLIIFSLTIGYADNNRWQAKTYNAAQYNFGDKNGPETTDIGAFYPLGFSKKGWFAYSNTNSPSDVSLINLHCENEDCVRDMPMNASDVCYCPIGKTVDDLDKFGIQPLASPQKGAFPTTIKGDQLNLRIDLKKQESSGETGTPEKIAFAEIILVSSKRGEKIIGTIHGHMMALPETTQAGGWIANPFSDQIVVLVGYRSMLNNGQNPAVRFIPFGADLKKGFKK